MTAATQPYRAQIRGLTGVLVEELGTRIVSGRLPVDELLGANRVKDHFEVSHSVAREAQRVLQGKGLLRSCPNTGTQVNPISAWHLFDPDVMRWFRLAAPLFREDQAALVVALQTLGDLEPALKDNIYFERLLHLLSPPPPASPRGLLHEHAWPLLESDDPLAKPDDCTCGLSYPEALKLGLIGPGE